MWQDIRIIAAAIIGVRVFVWVVVQIMDAIEDTLSSESDGSE